jgi:hypothetical protein
MAFERAPAKTREQLAALFEPAAPLPPENVEGIREILDELGVRTLIEAEIAAHRDRALHLLRGVSSVAAAPEALELLERLVSNSTGGSSPGAAVAGSARV